MLHVRIGGAWLTRLRLAQGLSTTTRWPGGCYEASWTMQVDNSWRHPAVHVGARVDVMDAGFVIWTGKVSEIEWESGSVTVEGLIRDAEKFPAFDLSLTPTTNPKTAATTAFFEFDWPVGVSASVPDSAVTTAETSAVPSRLDEVLSAKADELGQRYAIFADGQLIYGPDGTVPNWHIVPGVVELGQASDNYRSDIFLVYIRDADNATITTRATWQDNGATSERYGFQSEIIDATQLGAMPSARADAMAQGILSNCAPRPGWTDSVDVAHGEIRTSGGEAADLSLIMAGDVVRLHGVYDDADYTGDRPYLDVVLGEVKWVDGASTISLAPVDGTRRDFASIQEEIYRLAGYSGT